MQLFITCQVFNYFGWFLFARNGQFLRNLLFKFFYFGQRSWFLYLTIFSRILQCVNCQCKISSIHIIQFLNRPLSFSLHSCNLDKLQRVPVGQHVLIVIHLGWCEFCLERVHMCINTIFFIIQFIIYFVKQSLFYNLSTMPRVVKSNKQKNKKFKGATKGNKKAYIAQPTVTKRKAIKKPKVNQKQIKNQRIQQKKLKKSKEAQKLSLANEYLDVQTKGTVTERIKNQSQVRVILLLPCNETADIVTLMSSFAKHFQGQGSLILKTQLNACKGYPAFQLSPGPNKAQIKNRIFVIGSQRQPKQLMDLAKCADIVCPVVSVLSADSKKIVQDPYNYARAFDQAGYSTINLLRTLGLPKVVGIIQHLQRIQPKNQDKLLKYYKRFLNSEFGGEKVSVIENSNDISTLFRLFDSCGLVNQAWKQQRGFFLADQIDYSGQNIAISGFLKGNCINPNQIAHLTGFDDYHIERIQIKNFHSKSKNTMEEQLLQYQTIPDDFNPFSKEQTNPQDEDILSAIKGLQLETFQNAHKKDKESDQEQMQGEDDEQDDNQQDNWSNIDDFNQNKEEEKAKRVQMNLRKEDELQFQDQVEYAGQEILREKYREYRGLKSFKATQWNQLENLPQQYDRIYLFKNYNTTHQAALKDNLSKGFAYPGFYVKVYLKGVVKQKVAQYNNKMPLIVSFLLKHERKMTVMHGKVQRNPFYQGDSLVNSHQMVLVSIGFKRILVNPVYSRCINGSQKTKYTKNIKEDYENHYFCSFYGLNYFPQSPFLIFRVNQLFTDQIEGSPILKGSLMKADPMHVILQRIILTGYPYKILKRRSTVRFMFFNPADVKYFRPVQVRTKLGLRGKIQDSLGTHGMMKVLFSDHVKHNDTVCMHLYRRVYPNSTF